MDRSELCFLPAAEIGRIIHAGEVSPVDATQAYLDRIDEIDHVLNSYFLVAREEAVQQAKEAEQEIAAGKSKGPLHGVPIAIKDQCHVKGWRTAGGSAVFDEYVADVDATVVERLREAGAVILGKLCMSELAIAETIDFPFGVPRNPWNLERVPGSSSAGSGAATSAFLCAGSIGGDTGGSIRIPSAYCGLVGLRPTWGRVSRYGSLAACWSMDTLGPMTRTVEDCALMLRVIAGHDPNDPYTSRRPVPDYSASLNRGVRGLKVGVVKELMDAELVDAEVVSSVRSAADRLEDLGARTEEVSIPLVRHAGPVHWTLCYVEFGQMNRELIRTRAADLTHMVRIAVLAGSLVPGVPYFKALQLREMMRNQVLEALSRFDVLICPTMPSGATKPTSSRHTADKESVLDALTGPVQLTAPFNLSSVPALSVPCGFTSDELPIGLQVVGRPFDEETVLRVGHAYQEATEWQKRRPPIS